MPRPRASAASARTSASRPRQADTISLAASPGPLCRRSTPCISISSVKKSSATLSEPAPQLPQAQVVEGLGEHSEGALLAAGR